jgi:hypothetical protein
MLTAPLLPESLDIWVTSWLLVATEGEAAGQVLEHIDCWHNLLKAPWLARRALGLGSSWAMRAVLGW